MDFSDRSINYRQVFFQSNKPILGKYYFCAYCGRLLNKKNVTVDHLYPVSAAKKSFWIRTRLKSKGLKTINDKRNLVPACISCNKTKAAHMGLWIIKGRLGRYKGLWLLRHTFRLILIVVTIILLFESNTFGQIKSLIYHIL